MLASEIIEEVAEVTGLCVDNAANFKAITRAVQLLANKALVDPLIGYFDFSTQNSYFVALPREVKTVLRCNINAKPTFARSRMFEFTLNTDGSSDAEENGLTWGDRGYSPIQDEKKLPGALAYKCGNAADEGKTCTAYGNDEDGREISETLTGSAGTPAPGVLVFHKVLRVLREATAHECFLWCNGEQTIGQYYGDETEPNYRVIKLSKNPASVRIMFRREVFAVTTLDSFIPMNSAMAVIYAAKAVSYFAKDEDDKAEKALARAGEWLKEEQAARDEHQALAEATEQPTATDTSIFVRDGITVGDVYDVACAINGPIGRGKILDRITTAVELLSNKGQWDARLGVVDIYTSDNTEAITYSRSKGNGLFVLPRYVEAPVQINLDGRALLPRNKWFEFHLNALGERNTAPRCSFDDCGEVCLSRPLPLDGAEDYKTRRTVPTKLVAVPASSADNDTEVRVYGLERLADGTDAEVVRDGTPGWACPCEAGSYNPGAAAPAFTRVDRITKGESGDFITLYATAYTTAWAAREVYGFWYPDEVEPKYRMIRVTTQKARRIRVLYRKRTGKFTSLTEPVPLRSRQAIECMLRCLKAQETDPAVAMQHELNALRYLREDRINNGPSDSGAMQYDEGTLPAVNGGLM